MRTGDQGTGTASVYCYIYFTTAYEHDNRLETVFGRGKQNISFGELLSKISKAGINPNELSRLIGKVANKIRQEWLKIGDSDSDYQRLEVEFNDFDVRNVSVDHNSIGLDITVYYKFDIDGLYSLDFEDFDDWDEYTDGFEKATRDAIDGAYIEDSFNDYDFTTDVADVDFDYDDSPTPPRDDYDNDDYVSVRYVPLNI